MVLRPDLQLYLHQIPMLLGFSTQSTRAAAVSEWVTSSSAAPCSRDCAISASMTFAAVFPRRSTRPVRSSGLTSCTDGRSQCAGQRTPGQRQCGRQPDRAACAKPRQPPPAQNNAPDDRRRRHHGGCVGGARLDELNLTPLELIDRNSGAHRRGLGATAQIPVTRVTIVGCLW